MSDEVLRSGVLRGVLQSVLGPDFAGGAWLGGFTPPPTDREQCPHKDGTERAVRDHCCRAVTLFYFPGPVSERDGPTRRGRRNHSAAPFLF